MVRAVLYLLASIFLISVVRLIIGALGKAFTESTMGPDIAKPSAKGGELRKCVVCGTYSPISTAPKVQGVEAFLCSDACVHKYRA